jgi:hypothetical protein
MKSKYQKWAAVNEPATPPAQRTIHWMPAGYYGQLCMNRNRYLVTWH